MKQLAHNIEDYLESSAVVDWCDNAVAVKAKALVASCNDETARVKTLFEWVRDQIPHSKDINASLLTCSASDVLAHGTGICFAKSHLLAAMLRSQGIPAGFCYQVLTQDGYDSKMTLHGLNAVYIQSLKRWIRLDPRGNTGSCNAQFSVLGEQLAFPMSARLGEFIYPGIYAQPATVVVDALTQYATPEALWPNLPEAL